MVKDILLKDVMIQDVATISQDEKVTTAAKIMSKKNIGSILVVDDEDPIGILTEKDLLHKVVALGKDSNELFVREVMTSSLIIVDPETTIFEAHKIMNENKFRRLPVVKSNKLKGIVTETDLSRAMRDYGTAINPTSEKPGIEKLKNIFKKYDLKEGKSYIFIEEKQNKIYEAFVSQISEAYAGLGIIRVNPETIKMKYGLKKTLLIWLTEMTGENCIKPTELEKLLFTITSFINNADKSIILLDGAEFIESYTSFDEVFHLLQSLLDRISISKSILLVSMDKETFDNKEYHLIERGFNVIKEN